MMPSVALAVTLLAARGTLAVLRGPRAEPNGTALRHIQAGAATAPAVMKNEIPRAPCSLMGGIVSAELSPRCCFTAQVVSQRGLNGYGLARPCRAAWSCAEDGVTPTADFEEKARAELCSEPGCLDAVVAAMRTTWSTSLGAGHMSRACVQGARVADGTAEGLLYAREHGARSSTVCTSANQDAIKEAPSDAKTKLSCSSYVKISIKATQSEKDRQNLNSLKCPCLGAVSDSVITGLSDCKWRSDDSSTVKAQWDACKASGASSRRRRSSEDNGGSVGSMCFPGEAFVTVRGRGQVPMAVLRPGDEVLAVGAAGAPAYEPVLDFIHAVRPSPEVQHQFLTIAHERGVLRATAEHLVFVAAGAGWRDLRAIELSAGDMIFAGNESGLAPSRVASVTASATRHGVFSPLTRSGTVVVDGVVASIYADPVGHRLGHRLAHLALLPVRAYHALGLPAALDWLRAALRKGSLVCGREEFGHEAKAKDELHPYLDMLLNGLGLQRLLPVS